MLSCTQQGDHAGGSACSQRLQTAGAAAVTYLIPLRRASPTKVHDRQVLFADGA